MCVTGDRHKRSNQAVSRPVRIARRGLIQRGNARGRSPRLGKVGYRADQLYLMLYCQDHCGRPMASVFSQSGPRQGARVQCDQESRSVFLQRRSSPAAERGTPGITVFYARPRLIAYIVAPNNGQAKTTWRVASAESARTGDQQGSECAQGGSFSTAQHSSADHRVFSLAHQSHDLFA